MKTIFLFIPNYVYSSDLLRTNYIKYLAEKFRVIVFLPMIEDDPESHTYYRSPNITYIPWGVQFPRFWHLFTKLLRISLIRKFDYEPVLQRNYRKSFGDWRRKFLRALSFLVPSSFLKPELFTKLEVFFLPTSKRFLQYVKSHQPSAILTPTPGFSELESEAIILAKKAGIPTIAIDFSWDKLHSGAKQLRATDYLIVWNPIIKREAVTMHDFREEQVFVAGIKRFDHYFASRRPNYWSSREEFLSQRGLDPGEKTILITTVTAGNYPLEHEVLRELLKAREGGRFLGCPNFFIRTHPKEKPQHFKEFLGQKNLHVEVSGKEMQKEYGIKIELDEEDLWNLRDTLACADVVVNYASTITLEACIFDRPVVNIGFPEQYLDAYDFTHYRPIVTQGAVKLAKSIDEMILYINEYLVDPGRDSKNRQRIVEEFVGFTDGKSYQRNVDMLEKILKIL